MLTLCLLEMSNDGLKHTYIPTRPTPKQPLEVTGIKGWRVFSTHPPPPLQVTLMSTLSDMAEIDGMAH